MGRKADEVDRQTLLILAEIENQDDPRAAWGRVKRRIDALREAGNEVPEALMLAERNLMVELTAASQGR
jgi:hypothetical protein